MTERPGYLGPVLATLVAVLLAGVVTRAWQQHRAEQLAEHRARATANALAQLSTDRLGAEDTRAAVALDYGVVADASPSDARYPFLRTLRHRVHGERAGAALDPGDPHDSAVAEAWRSSRRAEVAVLTLPAGRRGVARLGEGAALYVDVPLNEADGDIWAYLLVGAGAGLAVWLLLLYFRPPSRELATIGALAAGVGVLGAQGMAVLPLEQMTERVDRALAALAELVPGAVVASSPAPEVAAQLVFSIALIPLVLFAVVAAVSRSRRSPHRAAYAYITPAMLGMGVLILVPFFLGVGLAFTRHDHGEFTWVGLSNFVSILASDDFAVSHPLSFYFTLGVTLLWTALNVVFHASIGLALALVLNTPGLRFVGVYRVLLIVPWAVPNYITALIWKGMFNKQYGLINELLGLVGVEPVGWFGQFWTSFAANVTTNTWLGFPFMMVVALGALQSIPKDLYEAAEVDGASKWQQFREITLPLLKPAMFPALILGSIWTFNMFNIIYLVSGGAPSGSTDILITEAYRWAFEQDRYGYAAAYSVLIFLILLGYSLVTSRVSKAAEGAYE